MSKSVLSYDLVCEELTREPKRWLVTGGAGFIGSHIVQKLLTLGQTVRCLDNFATGRRSNLDKVASIVGADAWKRFSLIEGTIVHLAVCQAACSGVDFVLHQAALGSVPRSMNDPVASHRANVDGFIHMLQSAKEAGVRNFVYASSSSVYGDSPELPKVEAKTGVVLSPYAATKAVNEVYSAAWFKSYGFTSIGLRYFNVFGERQDPAGPYAAVIPRWIEAAVAGRACDVNGDGSTSRDFCHVENAVQANILAALNGQGAGHPVYNVAVGEKTTLLQLHDLIWEALIKLGRAKGAIAPNLLPFRPGDIMHSLADITKARQELGYAPKVRIKEGISTLIESWR